MKPSRRFRHALKALVDLALHQATGPVTVRSIARRQAIPAPTLEQLFNQLRRKGLVQAERGPRGGYSLARPADQVTLQSVFEIFEPGRKLPEQWPEEAAGDPAQSVWEQVEKAVRTTLEAATLQDLVAQARERAGEPFRHRYTFHI